MLNRHRRRRRQLSGVQGHPQALVQDQGAFAPLVGALLRRLVAHKDQLHDLAGRADELLAGDEPDPYPVTGLRRAVRTIDTTVALVVALELLVGGRRGGDRT
jgi:hypothetical protein